MKQEYDVVVIGGGIMGLFSAYYLSRFGKRVMILEKSTVCNRESSSNGLTRSFRQDYVDPFYANLARQTRVLWKEFESVTGVTAIRECGCLNLYSGKYGISWTDSYAARAQNTMNQLEMSSENFNQEELLCRFPQFNAEAGVLDNSGGVLNLSGITSALLKELYLGNVDIQENSCIRNIKTEPVIELVLEDRTIKASSLIVTSGRWTNDVLSLLPNGAQLSLPITPERPIECKYFIPSKSERALYSWQNMPVFAFLDLGIYGHPIVGDETKGVKIGYFNPSGGSFKPRVDSVMEFVKEILPGLADAEVESVTDYDQGYYQMTPDHNFILGILPTNKRVVIGAGWNGTGYKFAPLIGEALASLALGEAPRIDIGRLSLDRLQQ